MRALVNGAGSCAEQSLYQFISKSPWDAEPVRRALSWLLQERVRPCAWVVQPLFITKAGPHSVGVERQWVSEVGRVVNCQRAASVWLCWDFGSCPVDWRLALPECWTDQEDLRRRASIPEHVGACPPEQCAVDSVSRMALEWGLPGRPVVMDLRETAPYEVCAELVRRHMTFVVRVKLSAVGVLTIGLLGALNRQRMPVEWRDPATGMLRATSVGVAGVSLKRHGPAAPAAGEQLDLKLLGAWTDRGHRVPGEYWLTNLPTSQLGTVFRTAMLSRRAEFDLMEVGEGLGIRDFEGRSFRGWHHHMTMVSLAHAVVALSRSGDRTVLPLTDPRRGLTSPNPKAGVA